MLTKLILHNWQLYRDRVFTFDPITVFVGENDAGKSSVVRALKWLFLNVWDGTAGEQITWGEEECSVAAVLDGKVVERVRDKSGQVYSLAGKESRAFGKSPPKEVARLLNCGPENFHNQDDPAFWLTLTGGQAATALNEIFSLQDIDDALNLAASKVRSARAARKLTRKRLKEARGEKKKLAWVKEADAKLVEIESLAAEIEKVKSEERKLLSLLSELDGKEKRLARDRSRLATAEAMLKVAEELAEVDREACSLKNILTLEKELCRRTNELREKEKLLTKWMSGTCPLCGRRP